MVDSQSVRAVSPSSVRTWSELDRKAMRLKGERPSRVKRVSSSLTVALKRPVREPICLMASLAVGIDSW